MLFISEVALKIYPESLLQNNYRSSSSCQHFKSYVLGFGKQYGFKWNSLLPVKKRWKADISDVLKSHFGTTMSPWNAA